MSRLDELVQMLGSQHVLTGSDAEPYTVDWRGRYSGAALAVVKPGSTQEVAEVVRWCIAHQVPMVPQGGNTGMCMASVPRAGRNEIVLALGRMNRIRGIDALNNTIIPAIGNAELKALVLKVAPAFEAHRQAAKQIEAKLAGSDH